MTIDVDVDVLIFGGGGAGLFLLDELRRRGRSALLIERTALGDGQTIAAQGIIHGGVKYSLAGLVGSAAKAIRQMPDRWRDSLAGRAEPNLSDVRVRSPHCWLWRTGGVSSRIGLIGAKAALVVKPQPVDRAARPAALADCPGEVYRLDEPVIDTASLLDALARRNERLLIRGEPSELTPDRVVIGDLVIRPRRIVLTAGSGNASLAAQLGIRGFTAPSAAMQRRPLHMTMLRGPLPELHGHCVDAAHTRVTLTSAADSAGRVVWQLGGQIAEDGNRMSPDDLIAHARRELAAVLPGVNLADTEWATYRIDRAEAATPDRARPDDVQVASSDDDPRTARVLVAWPTKLALAPHLADVLVDRLGYTDAAASASPFPGVDAPRPAIALPPWETASWTNDH